MVLKQIKHRVSTYGKGLRITQGSATVTYGTSYNFQPNVCKSKFDLRGGDRIVYSREPGDVVGTYATDAHIEDSDGNDVTDDPYYIDNLYIYAGSIVITPMRLSAPRVKTKVYDGTTNAELDYTTPLNSILAGDDVGFDTDLSVSFRNPNVSSYIAEVNVSGSIGLTGSKAFCYTINQISDYLPYSVRITPAPLVISANKVEIPQGTDPSAVDLSSAYTITGLVNGETESVLTGSLSVSIDPAITSSSPAGVYPDAVAVLGYTATNYAITYQTADLEIKALSSQTITFDPFPNQNLSTGTYQLSATASSGLPVSYTSSNTAVATVDANGLVTFHTVGQTTITVSQAGDASYSAATSVSRDLRVNVPTNNANAEVIMYPNPVQAQKAVSVNLPGYQGTLSGIQVGIYGMDGNRIDAVTGNTGNIITFNAPSGPGVYIIHVTATGSPSIARMAILYVR